MTWKIERVEWIDSATHDGWHNPTIQEYKPLNCITVGFVVKESDDFLTLAGSMAGTDEDQVCSAMTIPKTCITNRKALT